VLDLDAEFATAADSGNKVGTYPTANDDITPEALTAKMAA